METSESEPFPNNNRILATQFVWTENAIYFLKVMEFDLI